MAASLEPTVDKSSTASEAVSKSATTEHASAAPLSNPEPEPELDFQGDVLVSNDIPTQADLDKCADLLVLDAQGTSRPFRTLYAGEGVAPRQLIIFVRHFFCGVSVSLPNAIRYRLDWMREYSRGIALECFGLDWGLTGYKAPRFLFWKNLNNWSIALECLPGSIRVEELSEQFVPNSRKRLTRI